MRMHNMKADDHPDSLKSVEGWISWPIESCECAWEHLGSIPKPLLRPRTPLIYSKNENDLIEIKDDWLMRPWLAILSSTNEKLDSLKRKSLDYGALQGCINVWQLMVSFWQTLVKKMCWFGECDGNFDCLMWDYWNWLAFYRFFVDIFWLFLDCLDYTIMDYSRLDSLIGLQGQLDYRNLY